MRRVAFKTVRALPGVAISGLMFFASVRLSDAKSIIAGNLHWLGVDEVPQILQTPQADMRLRVWSVVSLLIWLLVLYLTRERKVDFDRVDTWSVSMWSGSGGYGNPIEGDPRKFFFLGLDLRNLSATQARVLEFEVELKTGNPDHPIVRLFADQGPYQPIRDHVLKATSYEEHVKERVLREYPEMPLELAPNSAIRCTVVFTLHKQTLELFRQDPGTWVRLYARERRSSLTRTIRPLRCFDARLQKSYKGEIGIPWNRPWFYRQRLRGWWMLRKRRREMRAAQ